MKTIETLRGQSVPYRPNRRHLWRAGFVWGLAAGLALAWLLVWATGAHADPQPGTAAANAQQQQELDREQRERFHDDHEADIRVHGIAPDASGERQPDQTHIVIDLDPGGDD